MTVIAKPSVVAAAERIMHYDARRQRLLAENIANVDTPGYKAKDLTAIRFRETVRGNVYAKGAELNRTRAGHIQSPLFVGSGQIRRQRDYFEATLSGNSVNLEANPTMFNQSAARYSLGSNLLKKYHSMIAIATGA